MKTTRKILAAIVASTILISGTISTYAMENGQWKWMGQWQHSRSETKHSGNPWDMISWVATWALSEQEKLDVAYQYTEERVAKDLYNYFYTLYKVETFKKISESEAKHMKSVKVILDRYSLPTPTTYGELQDEFDTLKAEWEKGLKEALEAGLKIEMLDIEDIKETIKSTDNDDLKIVFTNIGWASYNHMRGFLKWLKEAWITTSIDYSKYLTQEQLNSKGSLKHILAEKLVSEWISLPEQVGSAKMKENCKKEESKEKFNQKAREGYKNQIDKKYGNSLKKLDEEKLQKVSDRIDSAIEKVENNTGMSDKIKERTLNVYNALKEYLSGLFR